MLNCPNDIYKKDNICLFVLLVYIDNPSVAFLVGNCHILFNYNRGDIKLGQVYQIMQSMEVIRREYQEYKILI
jgi:hypothetical protein